MKPIGQDADGKTLYLGDKVEILECYVTRDEMKAFFGLFAEVSGARDGKILIRLENRVVLRCDKKAIRKITPSDYRFPATWAESVFKPVGVMA